MAVARAEALSLAGKSIFLCHPARRPLMGLDCSPAGQHFVTVLFMSCGSLAPGPTLQMQPTWEESTRTLAHHHHLDLMKRTQAHGHPASVGTDNSFSPALCHCMGPQLPCGPCLSDSAALLLACFNPGKEEWEVREQERVWEVPAAVWELLAASSAPPYHPPLLHTTHSLHQGAHLLCGSFPCPEQPPPHHSQATSFCSELSAASIMCQAPQLPVEAAVPCHSPQQIA